jgi:hypothetical protein
MARILRISASTTWPDGKEYLDGSVAALEVEVALL